MTLYQNAAGEISTHPDPNIVRRVARAIFDQQRRFCGSPPSAVFFPCEAELLNARAAIEAMREPTDAMVQAAWADTSTEVATRAIWGTMINEALR